MHGLNIDIYELSMDYLQISIMIGSWGESNREIVSFRFVRACVLSAWWNSSPQVGTTLFPYTVLSFLFTFSPPPILLSNLVGLIGTRFIHGPL